jgi:hypothetical protein
VRRSLWSANSGISGPDWRLGGASLYSPLSNFRFGMPETGSICDGDRFAEPACRARYERVTHLSCGPSDSRTERAKERRLTTDSA